MPRRSAATYPALAEPHETARIGARSTRLRPEQHPPSPLPRTRKPLARVRGTGCGSAGSICGSLEGLGGAGQGAAASHVLTDCSQIPMDGAGLPATSRTDTPWVRIKSRPASDSAGPLSPDQGLDSGAVAGAKEIPEWLRSFAGCRLPKAAIACASHLGVDLGQLDGWAVDLGSQVRIVYVWVHHQLPRSRVDSANPSLVSRSSRRRPSRSCSPSRTSHLSLTMCCLNRMS